MKIIVIKVKAKDLQPGDLFSTADQFYWDHRDKYAVGEKVYIRSEALCPESMKEEDVFKVTIEK